MRKIVLLIRYRFWKWMIAHINFQVNSFFPSHCQCELVCVCVRVFLKRFISCIGINSNIAELFVRLISICSYHGSCPCPLMVEKALMLRECCGTFGIWTMLSGTKTSYISTNFIFHAITKRNLKSTTSHYNENGKYENNSLWARIYQFRFVCIRVEMFENKYIQTMEVGSATKGT